jgi:hypothetical protein
MQQGVKSITKLEIYVLLFPLGWGNEIFAGCSIASSPHWRSLHVINIRNFALSPIHEYKYKSANYKSCFDRPLAVNAHPLLGHLLSQMANATAPMWSLNPNTRSNQLWNSKRYSYVMLMLYVSNVLCSFAKNRNAENGRELRDAIRKNKKKERKGNGT